MQQIWQAVSRKKGLLSPTENSSKLARVFRVFDLVAVGVSSALGVGIYVTTGQIAKEQAGPAVIFSYLIVAVVCLFIGLCYAELGARITRSGSAYIYNYTYIGELMAFIVGWTMIGQYGTGCAIVSRGLRVYFDTLFNNTMGHEFEIIAPIRVGFMSHYFDFFACAVPIVMCMGIAFCLKESTCICKIGTTVNVFVILITVGSGFYYADLKNWNLPGNHTVEIGNGGFLPFGVDGVLKGTTLAVIGFVSFESLATTGEEVENPQKSIPIALITTLVIVFLAYFGISCVVTLMVPYYLVDSQSSVPGAFSRVGFSLGAKTVTFAGILGLFTSLYGTSLPIPRIMYAMSSDGLLFQFLGNINERFKSPVNATFATGISVGLLAALLRIEALASLVCLSAVFSYNSIAVCVLLLRYKSDGKISVREKKMETTSLLDTDSTFVKLLKQFFNSSNIRNPTKLSEKLVVYEICVYCTLCLLLSLCFKLLGSQMLDGDAFAITITAVTVFLLVLIYVSIQCQPKNNDIVSFKVPFVPFIPAVSILFCFHIAVMVKGTTWGLFGGWLVCGLLIYVFYGLRNSLKTQYYEIV